MASRDYIESLVNGLPVEQQPVFKELFNYLLRTIRFGRATAGSEAENFSGAFLTAKTPAVANTAFKIAHGLESTPYLAFPVLPLDSVNAIAPQLQVTQAADGTYLYLSSPVANAQVVLYVEA